MSIDHYENFPVASVLCPPALRPAVIAIYIFARTADDLADEGDASPARRLADLAAYRTELERCAAGEAPNDARWRNVFESLAKQMRHFSLPAQPLRDLLTAFEQDTGNPRYPDRATLLDYCRHSANPIGRLLLHLYGVQDRAALAQSDAICSALQLINFWQDLSVDLPRGRHYVPLADAARHGLTLELLQAQRDTAATQALVRELCGWARTLMLSGAPLVHRLPGRAGWELRLVVQGGLRILEKIERMNHATLARRPKLEAFDAPRLLWRALGMHAFGSAGSRA
ncbi:squalene synthase HpnC [Azohydromonas caseinilytica]|uniref:squalene synthase HpnC n=1 Tax=Azohydromonas caseinilytica TaxID=2728836 RepID=UPI002873E586|nr:squalene synthase HpnC [Azohydromonas caseinilytica]